MELEYCDSGIVQVIVWDPNKAIDREDYSVCGGGRLERIYSLCVLYIFTVLFGWLLWFYVLATSKVSIQGDIYIHSI